MHTLPGRLELPTLRLTASRSSQLSYGSTCMQNPSTVYRERYTKLSSSQTPALGRQVDLEQRAPYGD